MASLPGVPGTLGLPGGSGIQQPSGTPLGSDLSLDLPNPGFTAPTYNVWSAEQNVFFPLGIDAALSRVFFGAQDSGSPGTLDALTFDFSSGVPGGPSSVGCIVEPYSILAASSDAADDFWIVTRPDPTVSLLKLQSYSISSGSQLSDTDTLQPNGGPGIVYTPIVATSFSVGGVAHMALWYWVILGSISGSPPDLTIATYIEHLLQINDVSSGTPVEVASLTFPWAGDDNHDVVMDAGVFYDGAEALWTSQITFGTDDHSITGVTLYKFSVPGYVNIGSASFSGAYGFIGDSCSGHIYLLNIDGSVSDIDPMTFVATNHPGLAIDVSSNPIGLVRPSTYPLDEDFPFWAPMVTRAMLNPIYGQSTDPVTSQFFMQGPATFDARHTSFTRIQNFTAIDTLALFQDWGLGDVDQASDPIWVPSEQAMLLSGYSGGHAFYELIYPTLEPFCLGDHGGGGTPPPDTEQFLPNVWIVS